MKRKITTPFFVVSPKSFLIGKDLEELAKITDEIAGKINNTIFFSAPPIELTNIARITKNLVITSQTADGNSLGRGMGRVLMDSFKLNGIEATFLNHMEAPLNFSELVAAIHKAKELDIITIVCADTQEEAEVLATLAPDIILCEPSALVGTGQTSEDSYVTNTISAIRHISPTTLVMEGAGITCKADVSRLIGFGADGTGISSRLATSDRKKELLSDLIAGLEEERK